MKKSKAFRFFNMWTKADEFMTIVQESWQERLTGLPMLQIMTKLKKLRRGLRELNKKEVCQC